MIETAIQKIRTLFSGKLLPKKEFEDPRTEEEKTRTKTIYEFIDRKIEAPRAKEST